MMRLLIFSFCLVSLPSAQAAVSCAKLLSSTSLTSSSGAEGTQLSGSAQAYVNLIQFYVKQVGVDKADSVLSKILSSKEFINPFNDGKDSLSIPLSSAVDKIKSKLDKKSWAAVKKEIQTLSGQNQAQDQDRRSKADATSFILSPHLTDRHDMNGQVMNLAWQVVGKRVLLLASAQKEIKLFELLDGELKQIAKLDNKSDLQMAPVWQLVDKEAYVVAHIADEIFLYKLVGNNLEKTDSSQTYREAGADISSVVLHDKNILIANDVSNFYFLEIVNDKLKTKVIEKYSVFDALNEHVFSMKWGVVNDRLYLLAVTKTSVELYEVVDDQLQHLDSKDVREAYLSSEFLNIENETYIALSTMKNGFHFFAIKDQKFTRAKKYKTKEGAYAAPSWRIVDGRTYLAVATEGYVYFYELIKGTLVEHSYFMFDRSVVYAKPVWVTAEDRTFVSVGAINGLLYVYELVDGQFVEVAREKVKGSIGNAPALQNVGQQVHGAVGTSGQNLHIFKLFKDVKK